MRRVAFARLCPGWFLLLRRCLRLARWDFHALKILLARRNLSLCAFVGWLVSDRCCCCGIAGFLLGCAGRSTWRSRLGLLGFDRTCVPMRHANTCLGVSEYVLNATVPNPPSRPPACVFAMLVGAHHLHLCVVGAGALAYLGCAIWGGSCFSLPQMMV